MLFTTLRQLASISGRTIIAIGLTSATVLALAPSAKADEVIINNPGIRTIAYQTAASATQPPSSTGLFVDLQVGELTVNSNYYTGYTINVKSGASSGKESKLYHANATDFVSYTLRLHDGTALIGSGKTLTDADQDLYTDDGTVPAVNKKFGVRITTSENILTKPAGNYTETVVFSISGS